MASDETSWEDSEDWVFLVLLGCVRLFDLLSHLFSRRLVMKR